MKYGTYETAFIKYIEEDDMKPIWRELKHVHMTIHNNGFAEIIYYAYGIKEPINKKTMVIPSSSLISFTGCGYAN